MKISMGKIVLILSIMLVIGLGLSCTCFAAGKTLVFVAGPQGNVLWKQLIPQWEKETGNKVEFMDIPREDFDAFLKSRIAAGSQIDLIMYDPQFHLDYYRRGIVEDITNFFSDPKYPNLREERFKKGALDFKRMAGKIYFVPLNIIMTLYYYNEDIYQKYGITVPKTIEDEEQIATKLAGTDIIPMAYAGKEIWWNPMMFYRFLPMLTADNPSAFTEATIRGDIKWTSPFYIRGLKLSKWEIDKGILTRESLGLDYNTLTTLFLQGKVATVYQGSWFYSEQLKPSLPADFKLGVAPIPSVAPGYGEPCGCADVNLSLYSKGSNKEEALSFINFAVSKEAAELASNYFVSAIDGVFPKDPVLAKVVKMYEGTPVAHLVDHLWEPEITEAFKSQLQRLLLGDTTPEEVANYIQDVQDNLISEQKDFGKIFGKTYSY
ncbi:MAG: ABC transporter substrate-binding protein [Candidatus Atribacteria bacterium]|nr:ABC transporter substrate-binding protein [Candidatus Atribacteria bacterium]